MYTTVAIIGAGPSGLLLSHLLHDQGIDNVVLEHRSRSHVEGRIRAGQLDHASVAFLDSVGLATRLKKEGMPQRGINLRFDDKTHYIDLEEHTEGRHCTVYGQSELTKDMISALVDRGHSPIFDATDLRLPTPKDVVQMIRYEHAGIKKTLRCKYIIGCDGAHGPCRKAVGSNAQGTEKALPFAWIGLLSETPPISNELTYAYHQRGFALWSMRSETISRVYLQCGENDQLEDWPEDRFWAEMRARIGDVADTVTPGKTLERIKVPMRGFVAPKFKSDNIILAGDAAHTVPPSAAKGLNMAISDISSLSDSLASQIRGDDDHALEKYAIAAQERAWAGQQFSWVMTDLLHASPTPCPFENKIKLAQLTSLIGSKDHLRQFCKRYVGA